MTETSILSGAGPSSDAGIDMVPPGTGGDDSDGASRRRLLILGAIAGVIVLAAAAYLLLHKSSSPSPTAAATVPSTAPVQPSPASSSTTGKAGSPTKPSSLPKVAKQATPRDPFQPLVTVPVATNGSAASTTKVTSTSTGKSVSTTPTGTTSTAPAPPSTTPSGSPQWIELTKTHGQSATFKVGYAHHQFRVFDVQAPKPTSSTGTVFGNVFALIGVQSGDVTLQIGDATPFDLTEGVSHVV